MPRDLKSFLPTAEELLNLDLPELGRILLRCLSSWKGAGKIWQPVGGLNRGYFVAWMERRNAGLGPLPGGGPEYGDSQPQVTRRINEAWNWLVTENVLMHNPDQPDPDWFVITTEGEQLLKRSDLYDRWEGLGVDRVKSELNKERPRIGNVGGESIEKDWAWEWVRMKENKPPPKRAAASEWVLIAESRLDELRALRSPEFDFRKLIRLCEELNINFRKECFFATAMLTRSLLDHVAPIFSKKEFVEVANNYGGPSFKGTMQHLQNASRNVADAHLHQQIRKSETLPTAQQVNCAQQLDMLLEEIVRITREKG